MQYTKETQTEQKPQAAGTFMKRLGSTNYRVSVHFSQTSRETMSDKIMRLIRNDTDGKEAGK